MENIRETKKVIEIKGRKFVLHKYDPLFGSYLAFKVFSLQGKKSESLEAILNTMMGKDFDSFKSLSEKVLKYCSESLPAGDTPLINSEGNIAVIALTAPMVTSLFIQSVMFNISDFFDGDPQELMEAQQKVGLTETI